MRLNDIEDTLIDQKVLSCTAVGPPPTLVQIGGADPADGDVLTYDAASGKWKNQALVGGAGAATLSGDSDVSISSPADKGVLTYNATTGKWKNKPLVSGITIDYTAPTGTLTGWTQGAVAPAIKDHTTNPRCSPSAIFCQSDASSRCYAYIDPCISLAGKTISFDVLVKDTSTLPHFYFGLNSSGNGAGVYIDMRAFAGGVLVGVVAFVATSYTDSDNNDLQRIGTLINQWINFKIVIDGSAANATVYLNGTLWTSAPISLSGTGIAVNGGPQTTGGYFRNITIGH